MAIIRRSAVITGASDDTFSLGTGQGYGSFETLQVTLTAAQVRTLHQAPITLIAAPGQDRAVAIYAIHVAKGAAGYTGGADPAIFYATNPTTNIATIPASLLRGGNAATYATRVALSGGPTDNPYVENQRVRIAMGVPGFTGNGAPVTLTLKYSILDVS